MWPQNSYGAAVCMCFFSGVEFECVTWFSVEIDAFNLRQMSNFYLSSVTTTIHSYFITWTRRSLPYMLWGMRIYICCMYQKVNQKNHKTGQVKSSWISDLNPVSPVERKAKFFKDLQNHNLHHKTRRRNHCDNPHACM